MASAPYHPDQPFADVPGGGPPPADDVSPADPATGHLRRPAGGDPTWRERAGAAVDARADILRRLTGADPRRVAALALAAFVVAAVAVALARSGSSGPPIDSSIPMASAPSGPAGSDRGGIPPSSPPGQDGDPPGGAGTATTVPGEVVDVAGAVGRPGLVHLPAGARVADALAAAGGASPDADLERLNQAAPVTDGSRVYVPRRGQSDVPTAVNGDGGTAAAGGPPGATPSTAPAAPVDLNTATVDQLDTLPGVGPSTAQAIVDYRGEHGRFRSVDDLLDVRGIGEAKLAALRSRVRV